ncbi:MAG: hypothetical protein IJC56_09325 [Clostridia bacterium]|nr:hypothetical protein [Clostridia bacterium]
MSILIVFLWILLAAAAVEIVYGAVKRSGFLVTVGVVVALMCALGLYLAICCADSIYLTGTGQLI